MKVEYKYFVCQECGYTDGSFGFSKIHETKTDYDVNFVCPKCGSYKIKDRIGITDVKQPTLEIERLIRKSKMDAVQLVRDVRDDRELRLAGLRE